MNRYFIRWREVTPLLCFTPSMLIPIQHTWVEAENEIGAKKALFKEFSNVNPDHIRFIEIIKEASHDKNT